MIDFGLSEEQKLLENTVGEMLRREVSDDILRKRVYSESHIDRNLWSVLNDSGITNVLVDETLGGAGLGLLEAALIFEQAGTRALPLPLFGHTLATIALTEAFDPEAQTALERLSSGNIVATTGFERPGEGGAEPLQWVEFAKFADSLLFVGKKSVTFISDISGASSVFSRGTDLTRPCWHLEGPFGESLELGVARERIIAAGRILLAADSWGIGRKVLKSATEYAVTRKQFGRYIGEFQSIKHPLAELAVKHEFSRALLWKAASAWQSQDSDWLEWSLLCTSHITELALAMSRQCIFSMGAIGFAWESDMHLWLKRALFNSIHLGSPKELRRELAGLRGWN